MRKGISCFWVSVGFLVLAGQVYGAQEKAPTSQPGSDKVLVKIGDKKVLTQWHLNRVAKGLTPQAFRVKKDVILARLAEEKLFDLYIDDHPDLVSEKEIDESVNKRMKDFGWTSLDVLKENVLSTGYTFDEFREQKRRAIARQKLGDEGIAKGKAPEALKKIFEADPEAFNQTEVFLRQILLRVPVYATPAEYEQKRAKIAKIRNDLVSGKRSWDDCAAESEDPTRRVGGKLGWTTRYLHRPEILTEAAFKLKVGQVSEILETGLGFHLVDITDRRVGKLSFEEASKTMKIWLQREPFIKSIAEARAKYPIIGVQAPDTPPTLATQPATTAPAK